MKKKNVKIDGINFSDESSIKAYLKNKHTCFANNSSHFLQNAYNMDLKNALLKLNK